MAMVFPRTYLFMFSCWLNEKENHLHHGYLGETIFLGQMQECNHLFSYFMFGWSFLKLESHTRDLLNSVGMDLRLPLSLSAPVYITHIFRYHFTMVPYFQ